LAGDEIVLDTRGKKCPRPFTDLVRTLIRLRGRGTIRVYTDDESCATFIPKHVEEVGLVVDGISREDGYLVITVRGRSSRPPASDCAGTGPASAHALARLPAGAINPLSRELKSVIPPIRVEFALAADRAGGSPGFSAVDRPRRRLYQYT